MVRFDIIENPKTGNRNLVTIFLGVSEEEKSKVEEKAKKTGINQVIFGDEMLEYVTQTEICITESGKKIPYKKGMKITFFDNGNFLAVKLQ